MFDSGDGNEPMILVAGQQNLHESRGVRDGHAIVSREERASDK